MKEGDEEGYVGGVRDVFFVFTTAELVSVSSFYLFIYLFIYLIFTVDREEVVNAGVSEGNT